jgi:hypothetical protein
VLFQGPERIVVIRGLFGFHGFETFAKDQK